jgi:hypothetical protein
MFVYGHNENIENWYSASPLRIQQAEEHLNRSSYEEIAPKLL